MNEQTANSQANAAADNAAPTLSDRVRSLRLPERTSAERSGWPWLPWVLCGVLAVATAYFAVRSFAGSRSDTSADTAAATTSKSGNQTAAQPVKQPPAGEIVQESKGWIVPVRRILVSPEVEGKIVELNLREGMQVDEKHVLAELERDKYQARFHKARGLRDAAWQRYLELLLGNREEEIVQAQAKLESMEAKRVALYKDLKRNVSLQTSQALSARDYEDTQSSFEAMDGEVKWLRQAYKLALDGARAERVDAAWAEYEAALGDYAEAAWMLKNTKVYAPIKGTILTKNAEKGSKVSPQPFSNDKGISSSLCELADLTDLEVDLAIAERDISRIFEGQKCRIRAEAYPNRVYDGWVSRLMPIADRAKASVPVRVKIRIKDAEGNFVFDDDAEGRFLRPEMGAIVTFFNARWEKQK